MIFNRAITVILAIFVVSSIAYAFIKEMRASDSNPADGASSDSTGLSTSERDLTGGQDGPDAENFGEITVPLTLASDNLQPNRIQVFYFHRRIRCTGCINVEEASFEAVSVDHKADVDSGILEWRSIDFDEEENKPYVSEYGLYSQELIFIEMRDGIGVRNGKIPEVWEHWTSKAEIRAIVNAKIDEWLGSVR